MKKKNEYLGCGISATLIGLGRWDLALIKDMTFAFGDKDNGCDKLVFMNQKQDKFCCSFYSGGITGMGQDPYSFYDFNRKRHDDKPCYILIKVFKNEKEVIKYLEAEDNQ